MLIDIIGYVATTVSTLAFFPQVIRVYTTKSTKDISLGSFYQITLGAGLWVMYGFIISSKPVIISNFIIGCLSSLIIYAKYKYGESYDKKL